MPASSLAARVSLPFALSKRAKAPVSRRSASVRASAALNHKGRTALTGILRVPQEKESEVDAMWRSHEVMMQKTHKVYDGELEDDFTDGPRLLEFYVSKAVEKTNPLDPASPDSGHILYCVNEKYVAPEGLAEHMRVGAEQWDQFPKLMEFIRDYSPFMTTNGEIFTNYVDRAPACTARKGDTTINLGFVVPQSMERTVDALWKSHEEFMRETHDFGEGPTNDPTRPRLTQFTITKARELVNPMDPTEGFTGNLQYSMQETYASKDGIAKHMAFNDPKSGYAALFEALMPLLEEPYVRYADVGQGVVITSMQKGGFNSNIVGGFKELLDKVLPRRAPHEEYCEEYCPETW